MSLGRTLVEKLFFGNCVCDQLSESYTKVSRSAVILEISIFIRLRMANGQTLPVQFICHTEPYKNYNFLIDGAPQYFGF